MSLPPDKARPRDLRVPVTVTIWGCTTGMLAICLSLSSQQSSQGTVISLAILAAAAVSTVAIWRSAGPRQPSPDEAYSLRELRERILNLETIATSGGLDGWQRLSSRAESGRIESERAELNRADGQKPSPYRERIDPRPGN
jgi:hypothetical protein